MAVTLFCLFLTLAFLEIMLSGDNAVVLASMANRLDDEDQKQSALTIGMVGSYALRCLIIIFGVWIFSNPILGPGAKLLGGGYLLYLAYDYFIANSEEEEGESQEGAHTYFSVIRDIMLADVAFSLDSASTALALSDNILVILGGCLVGVIALRFLAGWFCELLEVFSHLEDAGYIAVALVGVQLLVKTFFDIEIPELFNIGMIVAIFGWGFSERIQEGVELH